MDQDKTQDTYSLTFEHRQKYLYAKATGKRESIQTCKKVWKQILTEGKKNQYKKYLVEKNFDELGTIREIKELMLELSEEIEDEIFAYIDYNPENFQTIKLAEISASNIGIEMKFFNSIGEAKEWLLLQ